MARKVIQRVARGTKKDESVKPTQVTHEGSIIMKPAIEPNQQAIEERLIDSEEVQKLDLSSFIGRTDRLTSEERKLLQDTLHNFELIAVDFVRSSVKEMSSFVRGSKKARSRARKNISQSLHMLTELRSKFSPKNFDDCLVSIEGDRRSEVSARNFKGKNHGKVLKKQREKTQVPKFRKIKG